MPKPKVTYTAGICISLWLEVSVQANSLEEALQIAQQQKRADLVKVADSSAALNDDIVTVVGASRSLPEPF